MRIDKSDVEAVGRLEGFVKTFRESLGAFEPPLTRLAEAERAARDHIEQDFHYWPFGNISSDVGTCLHELDNILESIREAAPELV